MLPEAVRPLVPLYENTTSSISLAMATGNVHKNFREVRPLGFRVMRADRQTDRQTHANRNASRPSAAWSTYVTLRCGRLTTAPRRRRRRSSRVCSVWRPRRCRRRPSPSYSTSPSRFSPSTKTRRGDRPRYVIELWNYWTASHAVAA